MARLTTMGRGLRPDTLLAELAVVSPDVPALVDEHSRATRAELSQRVEEAEGRLLNMGLRSGVVGLQLGNRIDTLALYLAAWRSGLTPVNVNRRYTPAETTQVLDMHALAGLVTDDPNCGALVDRRGGRPVALAHLDESFTVLSVRPEPGETGEGPEYLLMTGGTTGFPKLVEWRMHDVVLSAMYPRSHPSVDPDPAVLLRRSTADPGDPVLIAAPVDHAFGQWVTFGALLAGGCAVLSDRRPLDAFHLLELADRERCTEIYVAGQAFVQRLADALEAGGVRPSHLRAIVTSGATTLDASKRKLWRFLPDVEILESVGASEAGSVGRVRQRSTQAGSLTPRFEPLAGTQVVDDSLSPTTRGATGRLARRGAVALGYVDGPRSPHFPSSRSARERLVVLSDAVQLHDDGTFTLRGRLDRVINTGGEKVDPIEVEEVLKTHPDVLDCVVVGMQDSRLGEVVAAALCTGGRDVPLDVVREVAAERLARFKAPSRVLAFNDFPRLDSGKVDLPVIVAAFEAAAT